MKKAKDRHCCGSLRLEWRRRPPSNFEKLQVVGWCPETSAKVNRKGVNAVGFKYYKILMPSLTEGAIFTMSVSQLNTKTQISKRNWAKERNFPFLRQEVVINLVVVLSYIKNMVSYLNTMQGIDVMSWYNTFLAEQSISEAIQASKCRSRARLALALCIGTGFVEAATSIQYEASIQVFTSIFLPSEQWRILWIFY